MVRKRVPVNNICTFMSNSGDRLREERERLGFSQTAFGAVGGVQKQAQLKYEKGERHPDVSYLEAIAKVGADIQFIVLGIRSTAALSSDETELLEKYRAAPIAVKAAAVAALTAGGAPQPANKFQGSMQVFHGSTGDIAGRDIVKKGKSQ